MWKKIGMYILFIFFSFVCKIGVQAQEYPISNQYHFNYYLANPAAAGSKDCSYFMLTHHQQWIGMKDAPMTESFSFQTRLKSNLGIGAYIFADKNGYSVQQGAQVSLAYHIPLEEGNRYSIHVNKERQLSFAVSAKFFNFDFDPDLYLASVGNNPDPAYLDFSSVKAFNTNVGVYFISYGFSVGLSVLNLAAMKMPSYNVDLEPIIPITGLFFLGNEFKINRTETIEPSLMLKANVLGEIQGDINFKYLQKIPRDNFAYWFQLTYRHVLDDGNTQSLNIMPMVGLQFDRFDIGYTFSVDLNRLARHNYGTHQLMIGYTLCL